MVKFQGFEVLRPQPIVVVGTLHYHASTRSRSMILLKKEIRERFLAFVGDAPPIGYRLEYLGTIEAIEKRLKELPEDAVPFLMFLVKEI